MGELRNPSDPANHGLKTEKQNLKDEENNKENVRHLRFSLPKSGSAAVDLPSWDAALSAGRLYVRADGRCLSSGSRDAFLGMLEYAEEELGVAHVVLCVDGGAVAAAAVGAGMARSLMFLGFQPLEAGHEFLPEDPNMVKKIALYSCHRKRGCNRQGREPGKGRGKRGKVGRHCSG